MNEPYRLIQLANGAYSIRSAAEEETFHPVLGPVAEAEALYVKQLNLRERVTQSPGEFVIWDVGLGAGGNAFTAIRRLADVAAEVRMLSFDRTLDALGFAARHSAQLQFPAGFEAQLEELLTRQRCEFQHGSLSVRWEIHLGDFPQTMATSAERKHPLPAPHAIFFDAFSPARNPAMWTLPLFENLFRRLDPHRPCALATYSRSTIPRVTLLLAGFFVGAGAPVAEKEETTLAANSLSLIERPLGARWLERARTSHSAEPLHGNEYRIAALTPETWERLRAHPQFK
jgi:tRNA U34 5-methylaminomethyl-2-thiouridine-forming methyltransferase MnmC